MEIIRDQTTQPIVQLPIFNNWDVVALGWYFVCPSSEIKRLEVKGMQICGQELAIYRGADGIVRALDAYCPHMGTHFGKGKVVENTIRCFFHHWKFDGGGECIEIPCKEPIPKKAKVNSYLVIEKYESIWVYPADVKTSVIGPLCDFPEINSDQQLKIVFGKPYQRSCHQHVTMINGIDPQHLKTVHNIDIAMDVQISENSMAKQIDIQLTGQIGQATFSQRLTRFLLGTSYSYSMRYDHGNNGFLTLMKNVHFHGWMWPNLHMIFAYRPLSVGKTFVQPIYVSKKRPGIFGKIKTALLIWATKQAFFALQGEDGEVYENMRFFPANLLSIDKPVAQYIKYVNKLPACEWKLT